MTLPPDPDAIIARASRLAPADRDRLLAQIAELRRDAGPRGSGAGRVGALVAALEDQARREAGEAALVDKLAEGGALRPDALMRALAQKRLSLFAAGVARLGGLASDQIAAALNDPGDPTPLALACIAVGLDRAVFPSLLAALREINHGRPGGGAAADRRAGGAFGLLSPSAAKVAFARVMAQV
jgi:hypothetical protein